MSYKYFLIRFVIAFSFCVTINCTDASTIIKIGEEKLVKDQTSHPYIKNSGVIFEKEYINQGSAYVRIHFTNFSLAPNDYVEIENTLTGVVTRYFGKGKSVRNGTVVISDFWSCVVRNEGAIVRLISTGKAVDYGFDIDKVAFGYTKDEIDTLTGLKSICGSDDKQWAQCYIGTGMYEKARAVCRLFMNGNSAGTGWLIGSEGHIMTNNHVIPDQSTADNTEYEFMGEGSCDTDCGSWLGCRGNLEAYSGTLIKTNDSYDYSLVKLPGNLSQVYGYLQLRPSLPSVGERIYIPQHPGAKGKQISVYDDQSGGYSQVNSFNTTDVQYYADTEGGSSGSPVIAYDDNLVVALHHYGGCVNSGVKMPSIINDLGTLMPQDAVSGYSTGPVTLYQDCNYGGYAVNISEGRYTLSQLQSLGIINDDISSVNVQNGYKVVLYQDDNFIGTTVSLSNSDDCLVDEDFNDKISSVVVAKQSDDWSTIIEAENYSSMSGIETESCSDGGFNVSYVDNGDWLAYNAIYFPYSGYYTFIYKVASEAGGGVLSLDLNAGTIVLGTVDIPSTGDWQIWTTVQQSVYIDGGNYAVGLYASTGGWNIDNFSINYIESATKSMVEESASVQPDHVVEVYPNPVINRLYISGVTENAIIEVYNTIGQLQLSFIGQSIDASSLGEGMYILKCKDEGRVMNHIFIKQ
ncbi:carbohydrate-binding protein [Geofilum sp. OHC36d9]|uniref:carbohydrate-binding protein n=1 Tax=Geofilum sp. OHC36d9 TaxID=3458413 RepID=UPI004034B237